MFEQNLSKIDVLKIGFYSTGISPIAKCLGEPIIELISRTTPLGLLLIASGCFTLLSRFESHNI